MYEEQMARNAQNALIAQQQQSVQPPPASQTAQTVQTPSWQDKSSLGSSYEANSASQPPSLHIQLAPRPDDLASADHQQQQNQQRYQQQQQHQQQNQNQNQQQPQVYASLPPSSAPQPYSQFQYGAPPNAASMPNQYLLNQHLMNQYQQMNGMPPPSSDSQIQVEPPNMRFQQHQQHQQMQQQMQAMQFQQVQAQAQAQSQQNNNLAVPEVSRPSSLSPSQNPRQYSSSPSSQRSSPQQRQNAPRERSMSKSPLMNDQSSPTVSQPQVQPQPQPQAQVQVPVPAQTQAQPLPAIFALHDELYNVNDALRILCSAASVHQNSTAASITPAQQSTYPILPSPQSSAHSMHSNSPTVSPQGTQIRAALPSVPETNSKPSKLPVVDEVELAHSLMGHKSSPKTDEQQLQIQLQYQQQQQNQQQQQQPRHGSNSSGTGSGRSSPLVSVEAAPFAHTDLVRDQLATAQDVYELVHLFMTRIEPFFPFIHRTFGDYNLLASHEVLLATICAISARFSPEPGHQKLLEGIFDRRRQLIYEELHRVSPATDAKTRDLEISAVIYSITLNLEWPLDAYTTLEQYHQRGFTQLAAACGFATVTGVLERVKNVFIGLHMIDLVFSCRLGLHANLGMPHPERELLDMFTLRDRAQVGVSHLLALASKTLFVSRRATREVVANGSFLGLLDLLHPHFKGWAEEFKEVVEDKEWASQSILFEFHHCQLYVYSLALVSQQEKLNTTRAPSEIRTKALKFINIAIDAAIDIISFESADNEVGIYLAPPMRWVLRLIHATVFLSKVLVLSSLPLSQERRIQMYDAVCLAGESMKRAGPDNFQLVGHYIEMMESIKDQLSQALFGNTESNGDSANSVGANGGVGNGGNGAMKRPSIVQLGFEGTPSGLSPAISQQDSGSQTPASVSELPDPFPLTSQWGDLLDNYDNMVDVDCTMLYMPNSQMV